MIQRDLILIRGLFRGKFHWGEFPEILEAYFPERRIICVDIPGTGTLSDLKSPNTIEGMVESIRNQLGKCNKVDVIAISMGGMIGLKWAELYPDEIAGLVCINTSAKGFSPFYYRLNPKNYVKIVAALLLPSKLRESIIYFLVSNKAMNKKVVDYWDNLNRINPVKLVNFYRQIIAALNFKISKVDCKLLFISSEADRLVSNKATKAIAKAWKAPLIVNKVDGHDIALDNPRWLCEQMVRWQNNA